MKSNFTPEETGTAGRGISEEEKGHIEAAEGTSVALHKAARQNTLILLRDMRKERSFEAFRECYVLRENVPAFCDCLPAPREIQRN